MFGRNSSHTLWLGCVLILVATLCLAGLEIYEGFSNAPQLQRERDLVVRTFEVITAAQAFDQAVQDAERGQRGYLLTGDAAYLDPYRTGSAAAPALLAKLKQLTADDPEQQQRMPALEEQLDTKLAELKRTIEVHDSQGFAAAQAIVQGNTGLAAMQAIVKTVDTMIEAERTLLQVRLARSTQAEHMTRTFALVGAVLAMAIVALGIFTALRAIQNIYRANEARRKSDEQFGLLVNAVTEYALYMIDAKGYVVSWNAGAERIKGYGAGEIIGQHFSLFYTEEDRQAGMPDRALETAAREGKYEIEAWRVRKGGARFMANVIIDPVRNSAGQLIGFAKITRDITERRDQQEVLERTRAALAQSQKMESLGQLTGGIAHDFNNLLQIIGSAIGALQRRLQGVNPDLRLYTDSIVHGVARGAELTQRLLAFTRRQPLDPKPIEPNKLVAGMSEMLRRTIGESIAIETVLSGGLWWVSADVGQLENAIVNLAVNARDAMPDGGKLTIETSNTYLDEAYAAAHSEVVPGQYVMIAISDTGAGMTPDVIAKAFEPFFTTKDVGKGTGLGLSQVYGFIKQSGGHIKLYSEPGAGTTVKLYLPRLAAEVAADAQAETQVAQIDTGKETILVVEDEDEVRAFTAEMLRELGYRVLVARDAPAALRILDQEPRIDMLFTDVGLPAPMNGRQLADESRRRRPALKVLFTTGYARNAIIHHGRLDPGVHLLLKPFTQRDAAQKVRRLLDSLRAD